MNEKLCIDAHALIWEIGRYLAAVDVFRAELCEPTWLPELVPDGAMGAGSSDRRRTAARTSRQHRA